MRREKRLLPERVRVLKLGFGGCGEYAAKPRQGISLIYIGSSALDPHFPRPYWLEILPAFVLLTTFLFQLYACAIVSWSRSRDNSSSRTSSSRTSSSRTSSSRTSKWSMKLECRVPWHGTAWHGARALPGSTDLHLDLNADRLFSTHLDAAPRHRIHVWK